MYRSSSGARVAASRVAALALAFCCSAGLALARPCASPAVQDAAAAAPEAELEAVIGRVLQMRDAATAEDFDRLGRSGEPSALEALLEVQPHLASIASRQRLVDALRRFVGNPALEHRALERLLVIAGDESSPVVQRTTARAMANAGGAARDYLAMVVDAPLADEIRILAMELHTKEPREKDYSWYREVWKPTPPPEVKGKKAEPPPDPAVEKKAHRLRGIVVLAFRALAPELTEEELVAAAREGGEISASRDERNGRAYQRYHALEELDRRGSAAAIEVARERFADAADADRTRVLAARILAKAEGDAVLDSIVEAGAHRDAWTALWRGLGEVVAAHASVEYRTELVKRLGRAKGTEQRMLLAALADHEDPKVAAELRDLLGNKDADLRAFAVETLARRKDTGALEDIDKRFSRTKDAAEGALLFRTMIELRRAPGAPDPAWTSRLEATAAGEDPALAVLALQELERVHGKEEVVAAHVKALASPDWSLRLAAARGLERLRTRESVQHLVARLGEETGRLRIEIAEMLWSLTGQGYTVHADQWKRWWDEKGHALDPITIDERAALSEELEKRRLEASTATSFFGLELDSQRVTFIIDVSGSMEELTRGRYVGEKGEQRLAVAKTELLKVLDQLDLNTLFNIIVFSDKARPWQKELVRATPDQIEKAKAHVNKFIAGGGTNVYEALEIAFTDQALDTLFVLSDGEPTLGAAIDPPVIRDHVRRWNIGRDVRIHTIAVGDELPILRWLAEDTGGYHAHIP